jgi:hypothetical protein
MDIIVEDLVDKIIINLKIIGIIKVNEKLCIRKGNLQIDQESNLRSLKRWFFRDTRDDFLIFIRDIIRKINLITDSRDLERIYSEFEKAQLGMDNLKATYSMDPVTIATIDNLVIKLNQLKNIKDQLKRGGNTKDAK